MACKYTLQDQISPSRQPRRAAVEKGQRKALNIPKWSIGDTGLVSARGGARVHERPSFPALRNIIDKVPLLLYVRVSYIHQGEIKESILNREIPNM